MTRVVHFDIPIDDPDRAGTFYRDALDWKVERWGPVDYWTLTSGEEPGPGAEGAMTLRPEAPEGVLVYFGVDDIDSAMTLVEHSGGTLVTDKVRLEPLRRLAELRDALSIPVEEYVANDELVVRAELPGVDPDDDVSVTVDAGVLHIRAQRREQREVSEPDLYRSELRYGVLHRSIRLPADAVADDVTAAYRNGVLTVRLPIDRDRASTRRIPVRQD